jgi:hypothetical protein
MIAGIPQMQKAGFPAFAAALRGDLPELGRSESALRSVYG